MQLLRLKPPQKSERTLNSGENYLLWEEMKEADSLCLMDSRESLVALYMEGKNKKKKQGE